MRLAHSPYVLNKPPAGCQLDTTHPLGRDVLAAWMTLEGGGRSYFSSGYKDFGYTYNGTITWTPTVQKSFGPAPTFDGTTGYITFPRITGFGTMVGLKPYTASVWFATTRINTRQVVTGDWNSGGNAESFVVQQGTGSNDNRLLVNMTTGIAMDTLTVIVANTWYHVCAVWDGVTAKVYVNGKLGVLSSLALIPAGVTMAVGRAGAFNGLFWAGHIGPFMVYNRALGPDEAKWLYAEPFAMLKTPAQILAAA